MIERHARDAVEGALADTPAILIVGARQVGKSTLAELLRPGLGADAIVSLDDAGVRAAALADPDAFIRGLPRPSVIDELQRAPDLLLSIKGAVDRRRLAGEDPSGSYLMTGSASIWDTVRAPESLAGRIERVRMWPLSQGEIAGRRERFVDSMFENAPPQLVASAVGREGYADMVVSGGYPEVRDRSDRRMQKWFSEYLSRLLDRDIRDLANVRRPEDLYRLLKQCATRAGSPVNVDGMLAELGIKRSTGHRYYDLLRRVYLIEEIPAWGVNLARAAVRSPKVVLCDGGLAAHLLGYSASRFVDGPHSRPDAGGLFESFLAVELLKAASGAADDVRPYHWRDRSGREVDMLLERRDGSVIAFECKIGESPAAEDFANLTFLRDQLGDRFRGGAVLHTGPRTLPFGDRLWACPAASLWA